MFSDDDDDNRQRQGKGESSDDGRLDTSKNPVPWPTGVAAVVDWRRAWP
jgi:hypothetical protein